MVASRILIALGAPALAICSPAAAQSHQPFALQDVDFTPDCDPNPALDRLMGLLLPGRPLDADNPAPQFDEPLYNAAAGAVSHVLHLGRDADWHGLRLTEVRFYHGIESGPSNLSLVFADAPEIVRAVWNARGWNLPPPGENRVFEDEVLFTAIGVHPEGAGASVTCFSD